METFSPENAALGAQISGHVFLVDTKKWEAVKRAFVNATALGNTEVVAAVAGKKIRVLAVLWVETIATSVKFQSATTDISAGFPGGANSGASLPYNPHGWFETAAGAALNVNLSVATATGVQVTYVEV